MRKFIVMIGKTSLAFNIGARSVAAAKHSARQLNAGPSREALANEDARKRMSNPHLYNESEWLAIEG